MSNKEAARLVNIAVALLSSGDDKHEKILVDRHVKLRAIDHAVEALLAIRKRLECEPVFLQKVPAARALALAVPKPQTKAVERAVQAVARHRERETVKRQHTAKMAEIGKAVVCIFETIKVGGKAIGDLWHSELEHLRNKGAFEAALLQAILHHCQPAKDMKVRDLVTPEKLAQFVADANRAVNRVKAAA